jgi:hypothetical protein
MKNARRSIATNRGMTAACGHFAVRGMDGACGSRTHAAVPRKCGLAIGLPRDASGEGHGR